MIFAYAKKKKKKKKNTCPHDKAAKQAKLQSFGAWHHEICRHVPMVWRMLHISSG